jgi:hypothetical protein
MWRWLLPIALLFLLGLASGTRLSPSGTGLSSETGLSSSLTGSSSGIALPSEIGSNPCQKDAIEGLRLGFHMGQMYALAKQGQNISGFNAEVDRYNAWVQQNFGNAPNLMMPKMQEGISGYKPVIRMTVAKPKHAIDASVNLPSSPSIEVNETGRIQDMPAGAWYTTYGSHDHHGKDNSLGWV